MTTTLEDLLPGDQAKLVSFDQNTSATQYAYCKRLLTLGLTPGAIFTVIRKAPFGDPVIISLRGASLVLRQYEARLLTLQKLPA